MVAPRFLADENLEASIVRAVRRLEPRIEFPSLSDVELLGATDAAVLAYAAENSLIVVCHDVKTMIEAAKSRTRTGTRMPGLFIVPQSASARVIAESLHLVWSASMAEEWHDRIVFLPI